MNRKSKLFFSKVTCKSFLVTNHLFIRVFSPPNIVSSQQLQHQNLISFCKSHQNAIQLMNKCDLLIFSFKPVRKYDVTTGKLVRNQILLCHSP